MFCYQCEQTDKGTGCTTVGMCGKSATVSREQDLLMHALKGIAQYTSAAAKLGAEDHAIDRFSMDAAFATLTNVNFSEERFVVMLREADEMIVRAAALYARACADAGVAAEALSGPATWRLASSTAQDMAQEGEAMGDIAQRRAEHGDDVVGMQEMILYGLKGAAAYADHARRLGREDPAVYGELRDTLAFLAQPTASIEDLVAEALKTGGTALKVLALLSDAHTSTYGHPVPTRVATHQRPGKAILISGHDLKDLEALLKQTEGTGIDVYTHGEMLPGHGYPALNKYPHLAGNYGGAWQLQQMEFSQFKGPILMTSNCILEVWPKYVWVCFWFLTLFLFVCFVSPQPRKSYKDRIFTCNAAGFPGVKHVEDGDFSQVIKAAQDMEGFTKTPASEHFVLTGFGHNAVLGVADKVVDGVKSGAIKHFFVIGGCDGAEGERNYFKEVATQAPKDTVILTLACGKYRFNKLQDSFGDIGGIPRLLDLGQCNDAYSGVQVALALQDAFGLKSVNDLPLSFVISWFEQKAVAVLLALLKLNIQNIRLGPKLPAFATPNIVALLQQNFNLKTISDVDSDIKSMMNKQ